MRAVPARVLVVVTAIGCGSAPPPKPKPVAPPPVDKPVELPHDDEPEDGVTFVNSKGKMDTSLIEAAIAPHAADLMACYTSRVGKRHWLGGKIVLHWDILADGSVSSLKLAESDLGAWPIEKCLMEVARTATFDKPEGGSTDFTVPLDFEGTARPMTWDDDKALRAVGGQLALLDACDPTTPAGKDKAKGKPGGKAAKKAKQARAQARAQAHGKGKPKLVAPPEEPPAPSDVTITLYAGADGKAASVGFASATSEIGETWAGCAEQVAEAWRLPDTRGHVVKMTTHYRPVAAAADDEAAR